MLSNKDPNCMRILTFSQKISSSESSPNDIFNESIQLIYKYTLFYDTKRIELKRKAWLTKSALSLSIFTLILLPLLTKLHIFDIPDIKEYLYEGFIFVGGLVFLKDYYNSRDGHIRYIKTQIALENLIATSQISWLNYTSTTTLTSEQINFIEVFLSDAYLLIGNEVDIWGRSIQRDEGKLEALLKSKSEEKKGKDNDGQE